MTAPTDPDWATLVGSLTQLGRGLVSAGLVLASGGNISARDPGGAVIAVTARGTWLDRLQPADFALVRISDGAVVGGAPDPSTELALHLECYRVRPDAGAVVHVHPQTSVLLAALGHPIRALTTDHAAYVGPVRVAPYRHPGTPELAPRWRRCWPTASATAWCWPTTAARWSGTRWRRPTAGCSTWRRRPG